MTHSEDGLLLNDEANRAEAHAPKQFDLAQENLRTSALKYRRLFEAAKDGILILILETGRISDVNPFLCDLLGFTAAEMIGKTVGEVSPFKDFVQNQKMLERLKQAGYVRYENLPLETKDGRRIAVEFVCNVYEEDGKDVAQCNIRDITERKRAEEKIAEQASFLDKARDGILVRDLKGKILYWNQGAERIYGWSREQVVGRDCAELLYVDPMKFHHLNRAVLAGGEWDGQVQQRAKDKRLITVDLRCTLIRDNEGHPKSILAIGTDVTERTKVESQLMRAQRMESIGTLAGGIAHDLNNILAPILMSICMLKAESNTPETIEILRTIESSAKRGADIVRQVLSFARGIEGERVEVQPTHLLKELEAIIKDTFPKDIRQHFSIDENIWTVLANPTQLHQILLNLCVNARDAMPNGGTLDVSLTNCVLDEQYASTNIEAKVGRYVNLKVTDTGTGIPPGIRDRIFEPFFTTKDLSKGTGLGLSTVSAIVKSLGGIINVYSELGRGTTFSVLLPASGLSNGAYEPTTDKIALPRGDGETILVVDDEPSILNVITRTLERFGYQTMTAADGAEAVGIYALNRNKIALVLADMMMPIMDGTGMTVAMTRINPRIRIIATSGLSRADGPVRNLGNSVKASLAKPYSAETLLKTIRRVLDEP